MKRSLFLIFCLMILQVAFLTARNDKDEAHNRLNAVTVVAAPETEDLAAAWIEGFRLSNPSAQVNLVTEDKSASADIRIITGSSPGFSDESSEWKIVVARDVLVPVMRQSDSYVSAISERGISPVEFARILSSGGDFTWGKLIGSEDSTPLTLLIPGDRTAQLALSGFAGTKPELLTASVAPGKEIVAELLNGRPGTIAFCRLADISDKSGQRFIDGIHIVPVDVNNNAKSDYFEQFYSDYNSFSRGVYIGKYPKALCNNIYAAAPAVPAEGAPTDLIMYILSGGQRLVAEKGFTALAGGEGNIRRETLASLRTVFATDGEGKAAISGWLWIMAVITAVSFLAYALYRFTRSGNKEMSVPAKPVMSAFSPGSMVAPAGIMYDKGHSWTFMEKNGTVRVGIDDFLQHVTGSITRVVMKFPGEKVRRGEKVLSVVQNGKKLDIQSPVTGTIVSRNEKLNSDTGIINSSPYDDGWVYAIEPENWERESRFMIVANRYLEYLKDEFGRIRDFLAIMPDTGDVRYTHVVLQDGGELRDGLLEEFGPEIWEEFQVRFLETPR